MKKIVLSNLMKHFKSYLGLFAELTLLLVVTFAVLESLIPMLLKARAYDRLALSDVICVTAYTDEEGIAKIADETDLKLLWRNKRQMTVTDSSLSGTSAGENISLLAVDETYFERFDYEFSSCMDEIPEGNRAVVPEGAAGQYETGKTYTVKTEDGETVTFTVYAVLSSDYLFIPPTEDNSQALLSQSGSVFLLCADDETMDLFEDSYVYMVDVPEGVDAAEAAKELYAYDEVIFALSCKESYEESSLDSLSGLGLPVILAAAAAVLSLTAMLADVLLKTSLNEYKNAIYYLLGFTWRKCMLVQLLSDAAVLACALLASAAVIVFMYGFYLKYYLICAGYAFLICAAAEIPGMLRMKKKNAAGITEIRE